MEDIYSQPYGVWLDQMIFNITLIGILSCKKLTKPNLQEFINALKLFLNLTIIHKQKKKSITVWNITYYF